MKNANVAGIVLEYEVSGSGEPLLLISPGPIADSFRPFTRERALTARYRVITYHQRGQVGSSRSAAPVSFAQHAADAAGLLRHLGVERAHVVGHSTGALIGLQLAVDQPRMVQSLVLLEPPLMFVPSAAAFLEAAGPAAAAYAAGDKATAMAKFLSMVSGLPWDTCRAVIDSHVPGGVAQAIADADTFFAGYLAALADWKPEPSQRARVTQPLLSVVGTRTERLFVEGHALLHQWFPQLEDCYVEDIGHLLHVERPAPVIAGIAAWLARQPGSERMNESTSRVTSADVAGSL